MYSKTALSRRAAIVVALVVGSVLSNEALHRYSDSNATMHALYHLKTLEPPLLFDPSNLFTISRYYLMENLASGLVIDAKDTPGGYRGVLAESWNQETGSRWVFTLRSDLRWSDGTPIDGEYVRQYFQNLSNRKSRHLINFQRLRKVTWEPTSKRLGFDFEGQTNSSVLHEFSLADAAVLHPDNQTKGWNPTSGPYFVKAIDWAKPEVILESNPHSPLNRPTMPQTVVLHSLEPANATVDWSRIDLLLVPQPVVTEEQRKLVAGAPDSLKSPGMVVYYFMFGQDHPLFKDREARLQFGALIRGYFHGVSLDPNELKFEAQFVPAGYPSRLESVPFNDKRQPSQLKGKKLTVELLKFAKDLPWHSGDLVAYFERHGINLQLTHGDEPLKEPLFAKMSGFAGNQRDSVGSWSYLYAHPKSEFRSFFPLVESLLEQALRTSAEYEKETLLRKVHEVTLAEGIAVPYLVQARTALHSKRFRLERWNPFDMRCRFFEVTRN